MIYFLLCLYIYFIILYIYVEFHLHQLCGNHVSGNSKGDEFDPELFEPTHNGEDGDETGMDASHGLHNKYLYDDDGTIHRHTRGTTMTSICHL